MKKGYLVGIDVGTSGTKAIIADETGKVLASCTKTYPLYTPRPGWAEQDPADWWKAVIDALNEILPQVYKEWARMDVDYAVPYYPHVSIGWDNNPRFVNFTNCVCKNNGPEVFEKALRKAKEYVDTHNLPVPLITVNSWNEWTETSYLEPDTKYGYGYLEAIRNVFVEDEA